MDKCRYLTAEQKVERNKAWDEYEKFVNPNARKWFEAVPYQLKYLRMTGQAEQGKSNDAETADHKKDEIGD